MTTEAARPAPTLKLGGVAATGCFWLAIAALVLFVTRRLRIQPLFHSDYSLAAQLGIGLAGGLALAGMLPIFSLQKCIMEIF